MNEAEVIRKAMSILGQRTSERKKISSRKNAKRPRKKKTVLAPNQTKTFELPSGGGIITITNQDPVANIYVDPSLFPKA